MSENLHPICITSPAPKGKPAFPIRPPLFPFDEGFRRLAAAPAFLSGDRCFENLHPLETLRQIR